MEHADLLYSGLMLTALMLSLWTAVLVTAACFFFGRALLEHRAVAHELQPLSAAMARSSQREAPGSLSKSAPHAATIASTEGHVSQTPAPSRSLSQTVPERPVSGLPVRLIH